VFTIIERVVEREENPRLCSRGVSAKKQWRRPYRTYYSVRCGCGRIVKVRIENFNSERTCKFCRVSVPLSESLSRALVYVAQQPALIRKPEIETLPRQVCVICHAGFFPKNSQQKTCGWYCSKLRRKRRSLPHGLASIPIIQSKRRLKPEDVLERDNWTCQLCSFPAPKHLRGSHSSIAPEVGHIIPHAQGGSYTLENLQCEHRGCNLEKNFKNA
jgi:hypothetical protein